MEKFEPGDASNISRKCISEALEYLMLLKEKRDGKVKVRMCANGRNKITYKNKMTYHKLCPWKLS